MPVTGIPRLGIPITAVALGVLLSLLSLLLPDEYITKLDVTGLGGDWGVGRTLAADLTPSIVDNSTSSAALTAPTQRKLFYAADRFWVFYSDGGELVYKSSSDGLAWSDRSEPLGASSDGNGISVHFDGTYVHYARTTSANDEPLYYRRGTPGADGTIAWSEAEQIAIAAVKGVRYLHPSVSADSSGHALISYHHEKQNGKAGEGPCVTMSGNNDGTWGTTPAGFPYELTSASESEWYTTVHGLTSDKIAVTFADHTEIPMVYVSTYDGAGWNPTVSTASTAHFGSDYSVLAEGDDLHIALLAEATFEVRYCRYSYATNTVGPESTLRGSELLSSAPALAMTSDGDLYCFWVNSAADGHIYFSRMISGAWDSECTDWLTETNLTASGGVSTSYNQGSSAYVGVAWETGLSSPYEIRFGAIQTVFPPNRPPDQPANVSPANGARGEPLTPTLQGAPFSDADTLDTHAASRWQITTTAGDYTSPVYDSLNDSASLTSVVIPSGTLGYSTTYYWHVSYQDSRGAWSENSAEWSFSTASAPNRPPHKPANVSPANWRTHRTLTPTLQSSDFADPDGGRHAASQWQVRAASGDYSTPVFDSQRDTANLLSIAVSPGDLAYSTIYYWHVRHQDDQGAWSDWSAETAFATRSETPVAVPAPPEHGGDGLPFGIAVGLEAAIALLAILIVGSVAYLAFVSLPARAGAPPHTSGLTSPDEMSERPKQQDE